ncbi:MAG: hypothetical protein CVU06_10480, partial [Bacteroidetes bacterium HGW-Bacteroidetes-22]
MRYSRIVVILLVLLIWNGGCKIDDSSRIDFDWNKRIVEDQLWAEALFAYHYKFLFDALTDSAVVVGSDTRYDSADLIRSGQQVILDYGDGRLCPDGRIRKGRITLAIHGFIFEPGATATMTFNDDFYFGSNHIGGVVELSGMPDTLGSNTRFLYTVKDGLIDLGYDYEYNIRYGCSWKTHWIGGASTLFQPSDDRFIVKGSSNGKGREHDQFVVVINDSLWLQPGCHYLRGGKSTLTMPGFEVNKGTLDYLGKDSCFGYANVI